MADAQVLLSCEQCKRRKTKCDKTFPRCSACKVANINCHPVQRSRLPRGRTGNAKHKSVALADKVARLENLVGRLEAQIQDNENAPASVESARPGSETNAVRTTNQVEDLLAKDFWIALSKEVAGLRETLEGADGEESQQSNPVVHRSQSGAHATPNLLFFNGDPESLKHSDTYVNQSMKASLIRIYYDRVDILFKVTHWPTVMRMIQGNDQCDITLRLNIASKALEWCICFTAATTLSDQDCEEFHLGPKTLLIEHCRRSAETFLSQSNFLIEPTFSTIQAFTIYLMGLRNSGQGALTWTFIALVIRLASVLDLGSETNNTLSALDIEQRRRVWFAIGVLDAQAAMGRGSVPLLPHTDLKYPPLNINDTEVGIRTVSAHPSTEMSFSCVSHQAILCQRRLCDPNTPSFQDRAEIVTSFESAMRRGYAHLEASDSPLERYTALLAEDVTLNMHLLLRRPPYKSVSFDTDHPLSHASTLHILTTATNVLERGLAKQHPLEFRKWAWFAWPRWYALAIVLVELCSVPVRPSAEMDIDTDRDREIDRAYTIALHSFNDYAQSASEITSGTIWTPIIKLMRRVQQLRGTYSMSDLNSSSALASLNVDTVPTTKPSDHTILSRYCDAIDYPKTGTATQSTVTIETNPDLLWDAFIEDLSETTVADTSASVFAPVSTARSTLETATTANSTSTWSLIPYIPILPSLDERFNAVGQDQRRRQVYAQIGQATPTRTERARKGHSVLGPIVL